MAFGTIIKIYANVPLDPRYEHTLFWMTINRQQEYFGIADGSVVGGRAQLITTLSSFSYHRKEREIRVPFSYDDLARAGANYCAVYNSEGAGGAGGWYFYFINEMDYRSNGMTALKVELDVLQTHQFAWEIPECFVEREHVADDRPGVNLVPEGLELGEIVAHASQDVAGLKDLDLIIQSSVSLTNASTAGYKNASGGGFIDSTYQGFPLFRVKADLAGINRWLAVRVDLDASGKTDAIQSLWLYPSAMIDYTADTGTLGCDLVNGTKQVTQTVVRPTKIGTYTPRNRKLLTYPYIYLYAYNNNGDGAVYHYELFSDATPTVKYFGNVANDGVVRLVPMNYRGIAVDNESGLSLSGFPTCAWAADMYKIWMAQNANSQSVMMETAKIQTAHAAVSTVTNTLTAGSYGGVVSNAVNGAFNTATAYQQQKAILAAQQDRTVQPPQARGVQSSNCNLGMGTQTFTLSAQGITEDYAKRIDKYFDMYGYQVNTVKLPEFTSRTGWNYVKTAGCIVKGDFNANDRRLIGAILDRGVTFWHAPDIMYRYDMASLNLAGTRGEDIESDESFEEVTTE